MPTEAEEEENETIEVGGFSGFIVGLALLPYVAYSITTAFDVAVNGKDFAYGPYGLEAIAVLTTVCLTIWSLGSFVQRGRGLPAGPLGLLGLAEGLSYLAVLGLAIAVGVTSFRGGGKGPTLPSLPSLPVLKAPELKAPDFKAPDIKVPDFKAPEFKAPEFNAPTFKVPEIKAPDVKVPEFKAPAIKIPEIKTPVLPKAPEIKAPEPAKPKEPEKQKEQEKKVPEAAKVSAPEAPKKQEVKETPKKAPTKVVEEEEEDYDDLFN